MAAGATSTGVPQINGMYKIVYGMLINAVPEVGLFQKLVKWKSGELIGKTFNESVILAEENGITYGGSDGAAYSLNDARSMANEQAVITAYSMTNKAVLSYVAASRARSKGKRAFAKAVTEVIASAQRSMTRRLEIDYHHGQAGDGIGIVAAAAIVDDTSTQFDLVFTEAQWAPGIWSGAEGAIIEVYDEGGALETTGGSGDLQVKSVNFSTRTVKVSGASALITQIETKNDTEALTVYFKGQKGNEMVGLRKIISNTTASVNGIDASDFGLWAGNPFDAAGQLTSAKLKSYAAQLHARGLEEDLIVEVNPLTWADLENQLSSSRVRDDSYRASKAIEGHEAIELHSQSGKMTVYSNPVVKGGEAFMFPPRKIKRIGSSDKEWQIPGQESEPWTASSTTNGAFMLLQSDQAVHVRCPARCGYVSGIVNETTTSG